MTTLASEASAAGTPLVTRTQFTVFYCTAVLSSPALSTAYSALELAAFSRFCLPAAGRQGKKVENEMNKAILRARNHLGYSKSGAGRNTARAYALYTLIPRPTTNPTILFPVWGLLQRRAVPARAPCFLSQATIDESQCSAGSSSDSSSSSSSSSSDSDSDSDSDSSGIKGGTGSCTASPPNQAAAAAAAAASPTPSPDFVIRPRVAKRAPLSPLPAASPSPQLPAAKRPTAEPPPTPPSPAARAGGGHRPPTPLFLPTPPEGLFAAGGEDIARAARREAQIEEALAAELRGREDGPFLQAMADGGAPMPVAVRALKLARAAVAACGPAGGKLYVAGLKSQISRLANDLVACRDALAAAKRSCAEWRRAALSEGAGEEAE